MSEPKPIRVLVVDDSELFRGLVRHVLTSSSEFQVVGEASDGLSGARLCTSLRPDVVTMDLNMGAADGFAGIRDIMAFSPTPLLVISGQGDEESVFRALALGALDVLAKPLGSGTDAFARELRSRLKLLAGIRVIQHVQGKARRAGQVEDRPVVAIAASLGGPRALATLLKGLPPDFRAPIVVVQHIGEGFTAGLASWLGSESALRVREAEDGEVLEPGTVLLAPAGSHLLVGGDAQKDRALLDGGPPVDGFCPAANVLFSSVARQCGARAVGVVLTGMGRDGAAGLLEMRRGGAQVIAQDEGSSVVFGMPRAAVEAGAVETVLPLPDIADALIRAVRRRRG